MHHLHRPIPREGEAQLDGGEPADRRAHPLSVRTNLAIAVILSVTGCVPFTTLFLPKPDPTIAARYEPPPVYDEWWTAAESCAHTHKDLHHWKWYAAKAAYPNRNPKLPTERNEVYVRATRTLDRTEVLAVMAGVLTSTQVVEDDPHAIEFFRRTLTCLGINYSNWSDPWYPNQS
jgi:hypothetical protein